MWCVTLVFTASYDDDANEDIYFFIDLLGRFMQFVSLLILFYKTI